MQGRIKNRKIAAKETQEFMDTHGFNEIEVIPPTEGRLRETNIYASSARNASLLIKARKTGSKREVWIFRSVVRQACNKETKRKQKTGALNRNRHKKSCERTPV